MKNSGLLDAIVLPALGFTINGGVSVIITPGDVFQFTLFGTDWHQVVVV